MAPVIKSSSMVKNIITPIDYTTFKYLGGTIFKDKNGVYISSLFRRGDCFINNDNNFSNYDNETMWLKINSGLCEYKKISGADPESIELLRPNSFGPGDQELPAVLKDNRNVYYNASVIPGPDTGTLVVDFPYLRDKNNIYCLLSSPEIILGADPETFVAEEPIWMYLAHDKNFIYYRCKKIDGSLGSSFTWIGATKPLSVKEYFKDKNSIYLIKADELDFVYNLYRVVGADPETFELPSKVEVQDKIGLIRI